MIDLRQTPEYTKYMEATGWRVEELNKTFAYIKGILFFGSAIKIQRPDRLAYQLIPTLIKKYRPFQIVIEPKLASDVPFLKMHGFKLSKTYFIPSKTIHIDLKKPERLLLAEMHYKTRYNIKKAESDGLKLIKSNDIQGFANFWQKCALKQRGMYLSQKKEIIELYKSFGKMADVIFALCEEEPVAGLLIIHSQNISYYMYAASDEKGKKLFAPTLLVWEALKISKRKGSRIFDFEGIYDERFPLKSWLGFTRFKRSFGGKEVNFPGTYEKFLLPFKL